MAYTVGGLLVLALWLYALLDAVTAEPVLVRNLPKTVWVFIVLLFPPVGPIAWLIAGRPEGADLRPGGAVSRAGGPASRPTGPSALPPAPRGPDDSPEFLRRLEDERRREERLRAWEADLRRREEELGRGGSPADGPDGGGG